MACLSDIFIELLEILCCLWDKLHNDYKYSIAVKLNNWLDVAKEAYLATRVEHSGSIRLIKLVNMH